ncbi:MAG: PIN domain-containing protein [Saprospiraceae bacterium]
MNTQSRRYLFIDFENLQQVKFKKLEKVASKIFVFIDAGIEHLPLALVQQMQRFGKSLKWVIVDNPGSENLNYHIAFVMGKFHQKLELDVEFAVVSHDPDFDTLVGFINASNRKCLRVKRHKEEIDALEEEQIEITTEETLEEENGNPVLSDILQSDDEDLGVMVDVADELIAKTAEETVKRLIRSGNRPAEVSSLKNYIHLHNQELSLYGHIDRIIQKMKESNDIEIRKGEVIYNF